MTDQNENVNSLRLGVRELNALLNRIEQKNPDSGSADRDFVRWSFRVVRADLTIEHHGGSSVTFSVATRNISRGGVSVLHSAFAYPGSRCSIVIHLEDGNTLEAEGQIARCQHLGGKVHELGIKFKEQISTKALLGLDPMHEAYSLEHIDPKRLMGTVLVACDGQLDQQLIFKLLEDTGLNIVFADEIEKAIEKAKKGCELVLTDYQIGQDSGTDLVMSLRADGIDCPILVMTSMNTEDVRDEMRMAGASGFISKPIVRPRLIQALGEFLLGDGDGGPIYSVLESDDPAFELLTKFLSDLPRTILTLEKSLHEDDRNGCHEIIRSLAGTAEPLGFPSISALALKADRALTTGNGLRDAASDVRQLIIACRRIKAAQRKAA